MLYIWMHGSACESLSMIMPAGLRSSQMGQPGGSVHSSEEYRRESSVESERLPWHRQGRGTRSDPSRRSAQQSIQEHRPTGSLDSVTSRCYRAIKENKETVAIVAAFSALCLLTSSTKRHTKERHPNASSRSTDARGRGRHRDVAQLSRPSSGLSAARGRSRGNKPSCEDSRRGQSQSAGRHRHGTTSHSRSKPPYRSRRQRRALRVTWKE